MAKQPDDKKTIELLPMPPKRGRPATGKAKTDAERQAAVRKRKQDELRITKKIYEDVDNHELMKDLSSAVWEEKASAEQLWREVGRRFGWIPDIPN